MRYSTSHKTETRAKILLEASRLIRRDGIEATGVSDLMAAAGLTNGAFYAHFASKEALVSDAVVAALGETQAAIGARIRAAEPAARLDALLSHYLDPKHVAHPEKGCAIAALGPELARRPDTTRAAINTALDELIETVAEALPEGPNQLASARAVFATLVGTIQLARNSPESQVAQVLASGRIAARTIVTTQTNMN